MTSGSIASESDTATKAHRKAMLQKIAWIAVGQAGIISYQQLSDILPDAISQAKYDEQVDSVLLILYAMGIELVEQLDDQITNGQSITLSTTPSSKPEISDKEI